MFELRVVDSSGPLVHFFCSLEEGMHCLEKPIITERDIAGSELSNPIKVQGLHYPTHSVIIHLSDSGREKISELTRNVSDENPVEVAIVVNGMLIEGSIIREQIDSSELEMYGEFDYYRAKRVVDLILASLEKLNSNQTVEATSA